MKTLLSRHVTAYEKRRIIIGYRQGETRKELAARYGYSYQTVWWIIHRAEGEIRKEKKKVGTRLREAERQEIKALILKGVRNQQIQIVTGRSNQVISEIRKQLKVKTYRKVKCPRLTAQEKHRIIRLSEQGKSISEIARITGRSDGTVRRLIKQHQERQEGQTV